MSTGTAEQAEIESWVDAAPFRTYLRHLMMVGGLSYGCVALMAGIRPRLALHLLHGRRGSALRKISAESGRLLLGVTPDMVLAVRDRLVPARKTVSHLDRLLDDGWPLLELARVLGVTSAEVTRLRSGEVRTCTQLTALRAAAECDLAGLSLARPPRSLPRAA
jgi:DNA-binding Xre family transcriptional regulator